MDKPSSASLRFASPAKRSFMSSVVCGLLSWSLFALAFLLVLTLIAYGNADPTRLVAPFSYLALCTSAFVAGTSAGKMRQSQGALVGMTTGIFLSLITVLVSFFIRGGAFSDAPLLALGLHAAITGVATLGGILGANRHTGKRKKRRHHHGKR